MLQTETAQITPTSPARVVPTETIFYTVRDFCAPRALPRSTFYALVKGGKIRITKRGARSLVHRDEAERFDASLLNAA